MPTLEAVVRYGRAVLVEDRVDYPEGTELHLDVRDPADDLDAEELAELDGALEAGQREYATSGSASSADDLLKRLRSAW